MLKAKHQTYNDGVTLVYTISDTSAAGGMPHETLTAPITARYEERTIGIKRYYSARQIDARCDMLIRIQQLRTVTPDAAVVVIDGEQYRVLQVQHITTTDGASATDLSLMKLGKGDQYDIG